MRLLTRLAMTMMVIVAWCFPISIFPQKVFAEDFVVNYDVLYRITKEGRTFVTQRVSLINKRTNLYAKEYAIQIDSNKIKNISASDGKGPIVPSVIRNNEKTEIRLVFNEEVVGLGNILSFQLNYEDENITKKTGSIWEVSIPGVTKDSTLGDYTVRLSIPETFGPPALMTPEPDKPYVWSKEKLINGGISLAFGKEQRFQLLLSYFLENPKPYPVITEIALPPTTAYQYITIQSITPEPETVVVDDDGNWLARYRLERNSMLTVSADIIAQLFLHPRSEYVHPEPKDAHRHATRHWQTEDQRIQNEANRLRTPKNIYDFVVNTLSYDYDQVDKQPERKGAVTALASPDNAVCMEFTDVFIALARAAGIPARQAVGYAHTTNPRLRPLSLSSDILHAWPEYYDEKKKQWIPVDPTWEHTTGGIDYFSKMDFNHIVFVYNGIRDDYPYPAGFYRQAGKTGKDIEATFFEGNLPVQSSDIVPVIQFPSRIVSGFATQGNVLIRNRGNVASERAFATVSSADLAVQMSKDIPLIPPYGVVSLPFSANLSSTSTLREAMLFASVNGSTIQHRATIIPFMFIGAGLILFVWLLIGLAIIIRKRK